MLVQGRQVVNHCILSIKLQTRLLLFMFNKDTMTDFRNLALAHTPLLENYHLAPNPQDYVQTQVSLPQDSHFFHLLLDPSSEKDE